MSASPISHESFSQCRIATRQQTLTISPFCGSRNLSPAYRSFFVNSWQLYSTEWAKRARRALYAFPNRRIVCFDAHSQARRQFGSVGDAERSAAVPLFAFARNIP